MSYRRPKPVNPHRPYTVAACGECPKGECDRCKFCLWAMNLPGAREHVVRRTTVQTNAIAGPQTYSPRGVR